METSEVEHREAVFSVLKGCGTHALTAALTACVRSSQDQAKQNLCLDRRGSHKAPFVMW